MGGACSTHGREEAHIQGFGGGTLKEDHLENTGVDVRIILRWILIKWNVRDWIDVAQDRDRWRALVNAVMNLRVP